MDRGLLGQGFAVILPRRVEIARGDEQQTRAGAAGRQHAGVPPRLRLRQAGDQHAVLALAAVVEWRVRQDVVGFEGRVLVVEL